MKKQRKPKPPLTERTNWNCGLCPRDDFPSFSTPDEMRQHAADVHDLPLEKTETMRRETFQRLDGADGFAQAVNNWKLPDGRLFATQVWTRKRFEIEGTTDEPTSSQ